MAKNGLLLFDTDVLIDILRYRPEAVEFYAGIENNTIISVMTCVELWAGVRNKDEEMLLRGLLSGFDKIEVTEKVADHASEISRKYMRSHGTGAVDAVIAATSKIEGVRLVTLNKKHYPMLDNILIPYKKGG
jgi:predicted nucleic acid-binding protein